MRPRPSPFSSSFSSTLLSQSLWLESAAAAGEADVLGVVEDAVSGHHAIVTLYPRSSSTSASGGGNRLAELSPFPAEAVPGAVLPPAQGGAAPGNPPATSHSRLAKLASPAPSPADDFIVSPLMKPDPAAAALSEDEAPLLRQHVFEMGAASARSMSVSSLYNSHAASGYGSSGSQTRGALRDYRGSASEAPTLADSRQLVSNGRAQPAAQREWGPGLPSALESAEAAFAATSAAQLDTTHDTSEPPNPDPFSPEADALPAESTLRDQAIAALALADELQRMEAHSARTAQVAAAAVALRSSGRGARAGGGAPRASLELHSGGEAAVMRRPLESTTTAPAPSASAEPPHPKLEHADAGVAPAPRSRAASAPDMSADLMLRYTTRLAQVEERTTAALRSLDSRMLVAPPAQGEDAPAPRGTEAPEMRRDESNAADASPSDDDAAAAALGQQPAAAPSATAPPAPSGREAAPAGGAGDATGAPRPRLTAIERRFVQWQAAEGRTQGAEGEEPTPPSPEAPSRGEVGPVSPPFSNGAGEPISGSAAAAAARAGIRLPPVLQQGHNNGPTAGGPGPSRRGLVRPRGNTGVGAAVGEDAPPAAPKLDTPADAPDAASLPSPGDDAPAPAAPVPTETAGTEGVILRSMPPPQHALEEERAKLAVPTRRAPSATALAAAPIPQSNGLPPLSRTAAEEAAGGAQAAAAALSGAAAASPGRLIASMVDRTSGSGAVVGAWAGPDATASLQGDLGAGGQGQGDQPPSPVHSPPQGHADRSRVPGSPSSHARSSSRWAGSAATPLVPGDLLTRLAAHYGAADVRSLPPEVLTRALAEAMRGLGQQGAEATGHFRPAGPAHRPTTPTPTSTGGAADDAALGGVGGAADFFAERWHRGAEEHGDTGDAAAHPTGPDPDEDSNNAWGAGSELALGGGDPEPTGRAIALVDTVLALANRAMAEAEEGRRALLQSSIRQQELEEQLQAQQGKMWWRGGSGVPMGLLPLHTQQQQPRASRLELVSSAQRQRHQRASPQSPPPSEPAPNGPTASSEERAELAAMARGVHDTSPERSTGAPGQPGAHAATAGRSGSRERAARARGPRELRPRGGSRGAGGRNQPPAPESSSPQEEAAAAPPVSRKQELARLAYEAALKAAAASQSSSSVSIAAPLHGTRSSGGALAAGGRAPSHFEHMQQGLGQQGLGQRGPRGSGGAAPPSSPFYADVDSFTLATQRQRRDEEERGDPGEGGGAAPTVPAPSTWVVSSAAEEPRRGAMSAPTPNRAYRGWGAGSAAPQAQASPRWGRATTRVPDSPRPPAPVLVALPGMPAPEEATAIPMHQPSPAGADRGDNGDDDAFGEEDGGSIGSPSPQPKATRPPSPTAQLLHLPHGPNSHHPGPAPPDLSSLSAAAAARETLPRGHPAPPPQVPATQAKPGRHARHGREPGGTEYRTLGALPSDPLQQVPRGTASALTEAATWRSAAASVAAATTRIVADRTAGEARAWAEAEEEAAASGGAAGGGLLAHSMRSAMGGVLSPYVRGGGGGGVMDRSLTGGPSTTPFKGLGGSYAAVPQTPGGPSSSRAVITPRGQTQFASHYGGLGGSLGAGGGGIVSSAYAASLTFGLGMLRSPAPPRQGGGGHQW